MSRASGPTEMEFVQRRATTLRPYWLYGGLSLAAVLFLPVWFSALFVSAIMIPKILLPARLTVGSGGLVLSVWLAETRVAWNDVVSANKQGKDWSECIRIEISEQARPVFLNIGYFTERVEIAEAIAEMAGPAHPLTRAFNLSPP